MFKFRISLPLIAIILIAAMNACRDEDPLPPAIRIAGLEDVSSYDALGSGKLGFQRTDESFFVIDADTKTSWGISQAFSSTMAPDGKYIAYVLPGSFKRVPEVALYDIEGDKSTRGSRDKSGGNNPSWTADSKNLLFVTSGDQTNNRLTKQPIAGDANSTITTGVQFYSRISSSVSDKLVFTFLKVEFGKGNVTGISTMNMDGTQLTQLVTDGLNTHAWSPAWSPDGQQIAYIVTQLDYKQMDVIITDKQGANAITIASIKTGGFDPSIAWSPDGSRLAFNMPEADGVHIFVIKPDGSGLTKLTNKAGTNDNHLSWSK